MRRFLISRLSSLGDVVCSLPAASALKRAFPDSQITWVVDERFADIVHGCGSVDEVVSLKRGERKWASSRSYDAALDLQGLLKSSMILSGIRAEKKVGYHWQREGAALFSQRVLPDPSSKHVVDQYVDVARAIGGEADRADFALRPVEAALSKMKERLVAQASRLYSEADGFVIVNPGSAWASKRWPVEHFATLIDGIGIPVVLIGSKGETGGADVAALCKSSTMNLSGETSIAELIALISLAKAHVGGDTGSTHIAAALGIPAIGLYSSTRPERSCPYGQISRCHFDPDGLARIDPTNVLVSLKEAIA